MSLMLASAMGWLHAADGVVVIGHANMRPLDKQTVEKIYTGKNIKVGDILVTAVNADVGSSLRERFLKAIIEKEEDSYTGRWLVMRTKGLGKPPKELPNAAAIINFVTTTPGAIGYVSEADLRPGLNIVFR
ncbi:MAG: hypothetical protein ABIN37_01185 [Burkholderiaceae bacterium]